MGPTLDGAAGGKKRKRVAPGLADLHDDMLERVLARLPPASYFRLRGVSRRWRAAAESSTFRAACACVTARDPWFLMLEDPDHQDQEDERRPRSTAAVFDSAERAWARWRGAPGPQHAVAAAGGLVLYRDPGTGDLTVVNPLTGAAHALPPPPPTPARALQAVAMYGAPYRVVLILGELPDLSTVAYDSSTSAWGEAAALSRKPEEEEEDAAASSRERAAEGGGDGTVYFLSKSGDVVATTTQRSASRQYSCAVACGGGGGGGGAWDAVAYFLSRSGTVVACDLTRRAFAELPRVLPAHHEHSVDVAACGAAAYAVVLSEFLDAASLRVWEFARGAWRQVAAMPPAMSHAFRGAKADVNCVGHGGRVMVCVSSSSGGGASGCFMCDVGTNRWEELPRRQDGDGSTGFVAALSFEPRMEAAV